MFEFEDHLEKFPIRLAKLRMLKNVSAREMSLSIGQGESYINQIENKNRLPSLTAFFYICDYLKISPQDFFNEDIKSPGDFNAAVEGLKLLKQDELMHIKGIVEAINKNRK